MFKKIFFIMFITVFSLPLCYVWGGEIVIRPKYYDANPRDGSFDPGSYENPYVIKDSQSGKELGVIRPRYPDVNNKDGSFDPGSYENPYIIKENQ